MISRLLIHAWIIEKKYIEYYLPHTHWIYLKEIIKYYDEVILLSPCKYLSVDDVPTGKSILQMKNVHVYELPYSKNYISSIKYFIYYLIAYKKIKNITTYYARYPVPFGWLQKIFGKNAKRIIHYVGDPIDVTKNNPNFSYLKRYFLV